MLNLFNFWYPWLIFFNDVWILQLLIFYVLCLLIISKNNYYFLFYVFLEIIFCGLYISLIQGELFTGFLWVLEFTIIFIIFIYLFYLNVEGFNYNIFLNYYYIYIFFFFSFILKFSIFLNDKNFLNFFNNIYLWEDYYEAFVNKTMNDFLVLTISYYSFNNFELLIIGFLLLVGSIICIILNKNQKFLKLSNIFFNKKQIFFFLNSLNYIFLRKQNLNKQSLIKPNIRMFKKKQS